jgi:porin
MWRKVKFLSKNLLITSCVYLQQANADVNVDNAQPSNKSSVHISANAAAVDITPGTGDLQNYVMQQLDIKDDHGIHFGGMWIGDSNDLLSGGVPNAKKWASDSLFIADLHIDTKGLFGWDGGIFDSEFLQFNAQNANIQAGTVQGYNSLPGAEPLDRSELYQLWYRQQFFNNKLVLRLGKVVPTYDFGNVSRPISLDNSNLYIPAVSGLIFTPIFVNPSTYGVMSGYYNSAYGATINIAPVKQWYLSLGVYDGALAQGVQTGLQSWPTFNGSYFYIAETGAGWLLGKDDYPGSIGVGAWYQDGLISDSSGLSEPSAEGNYIFGTQRLWYKDPGIDASGVSMYYQYGFNNSNTLPISQYMGAGITGFGLIPHRLADSFGVGVAYSFLNQNIFNRSAEMMYQGYYQANIVKGIYLEPAISYIPTPGADINLAPVWAATFRLIALF